MAKESVKILQGKLDVESLISQLNAALAEEWLAYYQYWIGALVVEGAMRPNVQSEFEEHANEERKHAEMIAKRIIELEGVPVLDPQKWSELARCKYDTPQDFDSVCLLNDNVASERCAILRYQEIADHVPGPGPESYLNILPALRLFRDAVLSRSIAEKCRLQHFEWPPCWSDAASLAISGLHFLYLFSLISHKCYYTGLYPHLHVFSESSLRRSSKTVFADEKI